MRAKNARDKCARRMRAKNARYNVLPYPQGICKKLKLLPLGFRRKIIYISNGNFDAVPKE
jgi:hypothetical protein